ncbi:MAG: type 2 isopentenyl-diphosphate Delta-isomerase [Candidatus Kapaibacterium sp.]|nr:MAG: type 2 isopentenyl-diphosphate Delta-isomerase [Candidatus Kapabacteria bacterium]
MYTPSSSTTAQENLPEAAQNQIAQNHTAQTVSRKKDHVELCVGERVSFREKTSGFERFDFVHNALPELDFSEISTETTFLGKSIFFPLQISSMTGGYAEAERINRELAEVCESLRLPMGVGSQRQALEKAEFHHTFQAARKHAPSIALTANIGAAELVKPSVRASIARLIDMIHADALTVHLNPLQELMQPEGNPDFRGVLAGIEQIRASLGVPIIAKEVGAGLSEGVARRLLDVGVSVIDVAGAGGTSWAGVELLRAKEGDALAPYQRAFWDWGLPTSECLRRIRPLKAEKNFTLVASGGISSGVEVAKSLALGADMAASARPLLQILMEHGQNALETALLGWQYQVRAVMFLTGAANLRALQSVELREV